MTVAISTLTNFSQCCYCNQFSYLEVFVYILSNYLVLEYQQYRTPLIIHPQLHSILGKHISIPTDMFDISQTELYSLLLGTIHYRVKEQLVLHNAKDSVDDAFTSNASAFMYLL
jgi:hypothetical protein